MDNRPPENGNYDYFPNEGGYTLEDNQPTYNYNQTYNNNLSDVPGQGKATAAMVLGILSLVLAWMGWFSVLGFVLAVIGVFVASSARREMPYGTAGRATTGLVLSVIAIAISIIAFIVSMVFYNTYGGYWDYYNYYYW